MPSREEKAKAAAVWTWRGQGRPRDVSQAIGLIQENCGRTSSRRVQAYGLDWVTVATDTPIKYDAVVQWVFRVFGSLSLQWTCEPGRRGCPGSSAEPVEQEQGVAEPAAQGVVEPAAHSRNVAAEPAALGQRQAGQEDHTTAGTMSGLPSRDTLMHKYLDLLAQPNATCPEYEINQSDCLGDRTFSSVYRAVHTASGQAVAIKVFKRQRVPDFTMELTTLRELPPHPNVIELLDVVRVSSSLALVFPLASATLEQWCADRALEPEEIASLFRQLGCGLFHVHANSILHADLKPSNILVTTQGLDENWKTMCDALPDGALTEPDDAPYFSRRARWLHQLAAGVLLQLADFGCSVCLAPFAGLDEAKTRKEIQTLWYRAPEIILGDGKIELAADVWSAGCILAELAGGSPIFRGDSAYGQMIEIFKQMGTPTSGPLLALRDFPSQHFWRRPGRFGFASL